MSLDAVYKVHAVHMTCHTQYEYVGCETSKMMIQLDRRRVQHLQHMRSTPQSTKEVNGPTTRTLSPNARGGRLDLNFDLTTPELPCGRVTRLRVQT